MKRAFLFDIDGTLVDTGGAGRTAMTRAFEELFHVKDPFRGDDFSGKTDPIIFHTAAVRHFGREATGKEEESITRLYLEYLANEVEAASEYRVLPGVKDLLQALQCRPDCLLGLCTGNIQEGARTKLRRGGLNRFFDFGGFGSDSGDRAELTRKAGEEARRLAGGPVDILVIGDSPLDYAAARKNGFPVALVGTGWTDRAVLRGLGPDMFFESFADTEGSVVRLLGLERGIRTDFRSIDRAAEIIRSGGIVIHPTSTLYGLGGDAADPSVSNRIRAIKGGRSNPFIVLAADAESALSMARDVPDEAMRLARRFWPGPLTMVLRAGDEAPSHAVAPDGTIALRVDAHPFALDLIKASGRNLVSTSANRAGQPAPASAADVSPAIAAACDLMVEGNETLAGEPSTVARITAAGVEVLRQGALRGKVMAPFVDFQDPHR
ncbi:MAG: threonylcarbamoyl-AMP synthase [Deltaproteobacteria bacterium]|nr:threonylcarbamoyl-AMP synthase [Deltaproteobacteria bacterium]